MAKKFAPCKNKIETRNRVREIDTEESKKSQDTARKRIKHENEEREKNSQNSHTHERHTKVLLCTEYRDR